MIEMVLNTTLRKTTLDNEALLNELIKEEDTLDDLDTISFTEYRKEAHNLVKVVYEFYTSKKQAEGSRMFFARMVTVLEECKARNMLMLGVELSIWAVRGILESLIKDYDSSNLREYLEVVLGVVGVGQCPPRIAAEFMHLVQDCSR